MCNGLQNTPAKFNNSKMALQYRQNNNSEQGLFLLTMRDYGTLKMKWKYKNAYDFSE